MGRSSRYLRTGGRRRWLLRKSRRAAELKTSKSTAAEAVDFSPESRVGHLLRRASHLAKANTNALVRDLDITPMQAAAVMALRRDGVLTQAQLGRTIGMEPANVHGLVARLLKRGVVLVENDPVDQRAVRVSLTERGRADALAFAELTARSAEQTLAVLKPEERELFLELLARVAGADEPRE